MMVSKESMKKWNIQCLQAQGGTAWPRKVSRYVEMTKMINSGIQTMCCFT